VLEAPPIRQANVVEVRHEVAQRGKRPREGEELALYPLHVREEVVAVPTPRRRDFGVGQLLEPELANRLEHSIARVALGAVSYDEGLVHEQRQLVENLVRFEWLARTHRLRGVEVEAARENRQAGEQHALWLREQVVTPLHGRSQRLLPWHRGTCPSGEQPEPVVQP
jgi:hypothetical protein